MVLPLLRRAVPGVRTQDDAVRRHPCRGRPARRIPDLHPPIVKGGGEPLFRPASAATLELLDQQRFATGAVIHAYQLIESGAESSGRGARMRELVEMPTADLRVVGSFRGPARSPES